MAGWPPSSGVKRNLRMPTSGTSMPISATKRSAMSPPPASSPKCLIADSIPADDLETSHRYQAACAAALAGCGRGDDAGQLDDKERVRWRKQALDWLRADLKAYGELLPMNNPEERQRLQGWLRSWQSEQALAGLRDATDGRPLVGRRAGIVQAALGGGPGLARQIANRTSIRTSDDRLSERATPGRSVCAPTATALS